MWGGILSTLSSGMLGWEAEVALVMSKSAFSSVSTKLDNWSLSNRFARTLSINIVSTLDLRESSK